MTVQTARTLKNFIGGQWTASTSGQTEVVPNPATEKRAGSCASFFQRRSRPGRIGSKRCI